MADVEMVEARPDTAEGSDSSEYAEFWIDLFLGRKGHEYFCDIDTEYITDRFNPVSYTHLDVYKRQPIEGLLGQKGWSNQNVFKLS